MWSMLAQTVSKSVAEITSSIFDFLSKKEENKEKDYVIDNAERLKKATNIAEQMWKIAFRNLDRFEERDREKFLKLHDVFLDYN